MTLNEMLLRLHRRLGMEGERARSEGGVTLTVDTLPEDVLSQLRPYRLCKAVSL